jgi:hypothetical protein
MELETAGSGNAGTGRHHRVGSGRAAAVPAAPPGRHRHHHSGTAQPRLRAGAHPRRRARAGHGGASRCGRRRRPAARRGAGAQGHRDRVWRRPAPHRSSCALRRQARHHLRPDRVTRDLMEARDAAGADGLRGRGRLGARLRRPKPAGALSQGRPGARDPLRFHRRLRRLPRGVPAERAEGAMPPTSGLYPSAGLECCRKRPRCPRNSSMPATSAALRCAPCARKP